MSYLLSFYIAWRYIRAKKRNHFVSFIALASMLGMALGVAVLIVVLSVMNGFDYQIKHHFFALVPQVTVLTSNPHCKQWGALRRQIDAIPKVRASAPFIETKAMLDFDGSLSGVQVVGIDPSLEVKVSSLGQKMRLGDLTSLAPGHYRIVLGLTLANRLGVGIGDKIVLMTSQISTSPLGVQPRYRQLTVSGIFHTGVGMGFDDSVVYINLSDARILFSNASALYGLHVRLTDLYRAPLVSQKLQAQLPLEFIVTNWTKTFGAFFHALSMEKTMMFMILILIVAVAAFNLVSTLVMVVNEKQADIAILRTLGAKRSLIMNTFIFQGVMIGALGVLIGISLGLVVAWNATAIVNVLQKLFHVHFISSSVYFINYLPSRIELWDVVRVALSGLLLSLLATIYPAYRAFKTQPAQALRYE